MPPPRWPRLRAPRVRARTVAAARWRAPGGGRGRPQRSAGVPSSCSRFHGAKCGGQCALQVVERAVVADDDVRTLRLLLLAELTRGALVDAAMPARACSLAAHRLVGYYGDRAVEDGLHPGLEQQRDLAHRCPRARVGVLELLAPLGDPLAHPRPEEALEPLALPGIGEDHLGHGRAIDLSPGRDLVAEALDEGLAHVTGRQQLADHVVARERRRTGALEGAQGLGLACGDPAGQPDERNAGLARHPLLGLVGGVVGLG